MVVVNLYGAPCSGKSTAAAYIFYKLKSLGINCELVTEVAKSMVWDENLTALKNQLYIAGNQSYNLDRLKNKVDIVITDAPLMLQTIYYRRNNCPEPDMFEDIIYQISNEYDNYNILLPVPEEVSLTGRIHDLSDSVDIHNSIINLLSKYSAQYHYISRNMQCYDKVVNSLVEYIKK